MYCSAHTNGHHKLPNNYKLYTCAQNLVVHRVHSSTTTFILHFAYVSTAPTAEAYNTIMITSI